MKKLWAAILRSIDQIKTEIKEARKFFNWRLR